MFLVTLIPARKIVVGALAARRAPARRRKLLRTGCPKTALAPVRQKINKNTGFPAEMPQFLPGRRFRVAPKAELPKERRAKRQV